MFDIKQKLSTRIKINICFFNLDDSLPATKVKAIPSRNGLWDKVKEAFILIHHHFDGKYDWVLKADDDR